jgi:TATA-box binding protein (TBP) (component of TFIID and TFIIIB)
MALFGVSNLPMHGEPNLFPTQSMVLVFAKTRRLKIVIVGLKNKSKIQKAVMRVNQSMLCFWV